MTPSEARALLSLPDAPPPSPTELRRAYRRAALASHPDRGGDEATMKRVNEAYEVLTGKRAHLFEVDAPDAGRAPRRARTGAPGKTREEQARELWICRQYER